MQTINERLVALRRWMKENALTAFIFPSSDPHNSEYVADHWKTREWISGFSGSAGTAVVTLQHAALWTDSRYFIAAAKELVGRMKENSFEDYLNNQGGYASFAPSGAAATGFSPAPSTANFPAMDMARFNNAFTKEGGTAPSGTYWTSMECKVGSEYKMATIEISGGKFHLGLKSKTETAKVRPIIYY